MSNLQGGLFLASGPSYSYYTVKGSVTVPISLLSRSSLLISQNVLQTMAELAPKVIFPRVVKHAMVCLAKPAFCTVTAEEVVIMNTPEGEIYNTSVLERLVCYLKLVTKSDFKFDCQLPGFLFRFLFPLQCQIIRSSKTSKYEEGIQGLFVRGSNLGNGTTRGVLYSGTRSLYMWSKLWRSGWYV